MNPVSKDIDMFKGWTLTHTLNELNTNTSDNILYVHNHIAMATI